MSISNNDPLLAAATAGSVGSTIANTNTANSVNTENIPFVTTDKIIPLQCLVEVK